MKKALMFWAILTCSLLFSCNPCLEIGDIHTVSTLDQDTYQIQEHEFRQYCKTNRINMFILLDANCSACLFSITWWHKWLGAHDRLKPVFIIKTTNMAHFIEYFQTSLLSRYPVSMDIPDTFFQENKLNEKNLAVIFNNTWDILYRGNPMQEDLSDLYKNITERL